MENREIRRKILEILYEEDEEKPGNIIMRNFLKDKLGLPDNKIDSNIRYLGEKGYIRYQGSIGQIFVTAQITSEGKDLVEDESEFNKMFPSVTIISDNKGVIIGDRSSVRDIKSTKIEKSPGTKHIEVSGDKNIVKVENGSKGYNIPTETGWEDFLLKLGLQLLTLDIKKRALLLGIPSIISAYITVDVIYKLFLPIYIVAFPLLWLIFLISLTKLYTSRTCNKCKKRFAYQRYKPDRVKTKGEYAGSDIYNIIEFYKCSFCGDTLEKEVIDEVSKEKDMY